MQISSSETQKALSRPRTRREPNGGKVKNVQELARKHGVDPEEARNWADKQKTLAATRQKLASSESVLGSAVAIEKAQQKDFSEVQRLQAILRRPFDEQPEFDRYADLPPDWASHLEVSCSS